MRRALVAAVALALVLPALAAARPSTGQTALDRVPSAQVQSSGSGTMLIVGRLALNGSIPGRGTVVMTDRAGDARVRLAGAPVPFDRRGRARVKRASGILFVTGSDITVQITGAGLTFSIAGNGRARFLGTGVYQLNSNPPAAWTRAWVRLVPPPPSNDDRRPPWRPGPDGN